MYVNHALFLTPCLTFSFARACLCGESLCKKNRAELGVITVTLKHDFLWHEVRYNLSQFICEYLSMQRPIMSLSYLFFFICSNWLHRSLKLFEMKWLQQFLLFQSLKTIISKVLKHAACSNHEFYFKKYITLKYLSYFVFLIWT